MCIGDLKLAMSEGTGSHLLLIGFDLVPTSVLQLPVTLNE